MPRKSRHEEDNDMNEDDDVKAGSSRDDDDDDMEDDDEDTIDLDTAEDEEEDDDDIDDDEDDEDDADSVDDIERRRLFQAEAEEILEHLTLDDVREVLSENEMDIALAAKLKKYLAEVVREGEVDNMDDAWEEAMERLEEEE